MSKDAKADPFANLHRSNMSRRFVDVDAPVELALPSPPSGRMGLVHKVVADLPAKKGKGGRPPRADGKPWDVEGISRALWYRRQAKRKA